MYKEEFYKALLLSKECAKHNLILPLTDKYENMYAKDLVENSDIVILNDQTEGIRLFNDNDFFLKNPENIYSIQTGHRVLLEICY